MKLKMIHESTDPTSEMVQHYEERTARHIDLVAQNLHKAAQFTEHGPELVERARIHDASKYGPEEKLPYIWLTEYHRCKNSDLPFEYPPGIEPEVRKATWHHISTNSHHPEAHETPADMGKIDLIEMVCDWTAMAQELEQDGGSARGWADKNIGSKWVFTEPQIDLIYTTIDNLNNS